MKLTVNKKEPNKTIKHNVIFIGIPWEYWHTFSIIYFVILSIKQEMFCSNMEVDSKELSSKNIINQKGKDILMHCRLDHAKG